MKRFASTLNKRAVISTMGAMMTCIGAIMIIPAAVGIYFNEMNPVRSFIAVSISCLLIGGTINVLFPPGKAGIKSRDGFIIVALCWFMASILGALPFILSGEITNPFDAFFETCSGFSTTGSTILQKPEILSKSLLFWRSFTHWLGGMGIIVLVTALIPSFGIGGQEIAGVETPGPISTKLSSQFSDTAKKLYLVYIFFTIAEFCLLLPSGMGIFDAAVHTFGTVGTGGFSSHTESIAYFGSGYVEWIIIIFMILCGINFNLFFLIIGRKIKDFIRDEELRLYLAIIFFGALIITLNRALQGHVDALITGFRESMFQIVSIITTTGYATSDYTLWPLFSQMIILFVMITGACSSSTGGGIKLIRIIMAFKHVKRGFFLKLHPKRVNNITINSKGVDQVVVTNTLNFIFFYIALTFLGSILVSLDDVDMMTAFSAVITCLSNVGPGFSQVGPSMNFALLNDFSKFILSVLMIAGRLEIFTLFIVLSPRYWNSNRV